LNSIFEQNRKLFAGRFGDMAVRMGLDTPNSAAALLESVPGQYQLHETPAGIPSLSVNGTFLHSRYHPGRDADRLLDRKDAFSPEACFFTGLGLAYLPEHYAQRYPQSTIVLCEPDIYVFLCCLASRPLENLLNHPNLILALGLPAGDVPTLLEQTGLLDIQIYRVEALMTPARQWWLEFDAIYHRNKKKKQINENTLRKFGSLWLRNMCKNLPRMQTLPGIEAVAGIARGLPALILAAGPSLDRILPLLPELRKRMVILAVDTAVRGCIASGVEPDFILVVDPQYWNYRHLDGISAPHSILITESAVWPAVYRFTCRATYLCASLFPLGKFIEERTARHAELGAGGSVSTSAWDFARHIGAEEIYLAGLDLGYPGKRTHFSGSLFEEWTHGASNRLGPAETSLYRYLAQTTQRTSRDYQGNPVVTDQRLELYVWWFESKIAHHPQPPTKTLTPESLRIPGVSVADPAKLTELPIVRQDFDTRLSLLTHEASPEKQAGYSRAVRELAETLRDIRNLAEQGITACDHFTGARTPLEKSHALEQLDRIDRKILDHPGKEIVAMVFSFAGKDQNESTSADPVGTTRELYQALALAAEKNLSQLKKLH
jgi:hypothetical protein